MKEERLQNYEQARNKIIELKDQAITLDLIESIQALVVGPNGPHGYRTGFGSYPIVNLKTKEHRYSPPNSDVYDMQTLTQELVDWLANLENLSRIEFAAMLHWGIVKIHPFTDGNGRTARLMVIMILLKYGYEISVCNQLEEFWIHSRDEYDDALNNGISYDGFKNVSQNWFDYMKHILEEAENRVYENKIQRLIASEHNPEMQMNSIPFEKLKESAQAYEERESQIEQRLKQEYEKANQLSHF